MTVAEIFNEMANEYDEICDLWYAWLFSRIHYIIARDIINMHNPKTVLDVGCGTGFQSFLYAAAGASVVGVDIAEGLIEVAKRKILSFDPLHEMTLFPGHFEFVDRYNKSISSLLNEGMRSGEYTPPSFWVADARTLPFPNESFDHVNSCGSTLSFLEDHHLALVEIARVLKPGGTFFLEVESKWNIDLLWAIVDALLMGRLGYGASLSEALRPIWNHPTHYVSIDYPFGEPGSVVNMRIKLFTATGLKRELSGLRLEVIKRWTVHSITNLIPSTYLHMNRPSRRLISVFRFLATIEERSSLPLPGCSMVFLARKED
jgi:ubiquinone/menaquinone biosynthesis C-methylase UbiE